MKNDDLGNRMKNYEKVARQYLSPNQFYILRIDGKAFHSYTKGLERPFDEGLIEDMQETMKYLCEEIQGAQFGYTQSDEITIVFTDLMSRQADIWFNGAVQKIVSVAASLATAAFNDLRVGRILNNPELYDESRKLAQFDARVFPVSQRHEALNCVLWRQQDASKNSIQMLARSLFSHKELQGLSGSQLQDKMMLEKGVNWNDIATTKKRGSACYKDIRLVDADLVTGDKFRTYWKIDKEIPIFSKDWSWFDDKVTKGDCE